MLRLIVIIFVFALIGLNSVLTNILGSDGAATVVTSVVSAKQAPGNGSFTARITAYAAETVGLSTLPMPPEGCRPLANPAHIHNILSVVSAEQREYILRTVATAPNMPISLYDGPGGYGICLPDMGLLVNLPTVSRAGVLDTGGALNLIQNLLPMAPATP